MKCLKEPLCLRLKAHQENGDTVSSQEIQRCSLQIVECLLYIHSKEVLQAGIGSQNILLDMGISKLGPVAYAVDVPPGVTAIGGIGWFVCPLSRKAVR
ncbi:conserved hypothetical protein [Coccidioides posadasii str. Silveira]|uniref:Protein kinase domain-containing protein n=1 Tax=Coccidioides posadasii (strain RMSCC 757 / Silveira) TaxID=443226 RepID=E9D9U6_COCPS|nr:conserved hypothetical protein [Coccidioides posadasii str. Silveira]